jgi:hypothetical protein
MGLMWKQFEDIDEESLNYENILFSINHFETKLLFKNGVYTYHSNSKNYQQYICPTSYTSSKILEKALKINQNSSKRLRHVEKVGYTWISLKDLYKTLQNSIEREEFPQFENIHFRKCFSKNSKHLLEIIQNIAEVNNL